MIELDPSQQRQIQDLLMHRLPHVTALAFGSRVTGWPHGHHPKPYSDLDIALWGLRPADDTALANLRADLEESALPWRVDISDANDLPTALRAQIERHGVRLLGQAASQLGAD
ncbi:MAG: nucleotidyltransferase domain-containing protein [Rhodoferax sp.]|jgi:predicted nucleotidyltransferase|uniref:nucleotidyltransferase family protein n=1 Tax=Rhodoferax sp. TaxID=50421 RepID=UPI003BB67CDF